MATAMFPVKPTSRGGRRPLGLFNAGSSTELCAYRVFTHVGGRLVGAPSWVGLGSTEARRPWRRPLIAAIPSVLE